MHISPSRYENTTSDQIRDLSDQVCELCAYFERFKHSYGRATNSDEQADETVYVINTKMKQWSMLTIVSKYDDLRHQLCCRIK